MQTPLPGRVLCRRDPEREAALSAGNTMVKLGPEVILHYWSRKHKPGVLLLLPSKGKSQIVKISKLDFFFKKNFSQQQY